jgi:hypothetical protein
MADTRPKEEKKSSSSFWENWSSIFVLIFLWYLGRNVWYSKLRYSIQCGVPYSQVTKQNEPHDCDFLKAPIGEKNCHYEIEVTKTTTTERDIEGPSVRTATNNGGEAMISFDDGKTWVAKRSIPTKEFVYLSWNKVEDE